MGRVALKTEPAHSFDVASQWNEPSQHVGKKILTDLWSETVERLHPSHPIRIASATSGKQQCDTLRRRGRIPHVVLDGLFPTGLLEAVASENPEEIGDAEGCLRNYLCFGPDQYEKSKNIIPFEHLLGVATQLLYGVLRSSVWIGLLQEIFEVKGLIADPMLKGSGVHQ